MTTPRKAAGSSPFDVSIATVIGFIAKGIVLGKQAHQLPEASGCVVDLQLGR